MTLPPRPLPLMMRAMAHSIAQLAGSTLVAGFPAPAAPVEILRDLASSELAGVILFKRNIGEPEEVMRLNTSIIEASSEPPIIAVDQEGGRVARLGPPVITLPPMRALGRLRDPKLTRAAGKVLGAQLRALGFSIDFAPILDVDTNPANPVIGDRAFCHLAEIVKEQALAFSDGLLEARIASCGKHFPGHGDTDLDSHLALPALRHSRARLDAVELLPFRAARRRIPSLMTAHVVFESLDPGVPATMSERVIRGLLREELGYDGLIISDDLEMRAVYDLYGIEESAVRAIRAGCDLLLICSRYDDLRLAREALIREAEASTEFKARLEDAAKRTLSFRRRFAPSIDEEGFLYSIHGAEAAKLSERLRAALPDSYA